MWEQIRSNQIRSAVLVAGMGVLLLFVGYFLGIYFLDSFIGGLIIALIVWAGMSLVAFFQGDNILLALAQARKVSHDDHPRLYNIVEEMKIASGLEKMPDIYIIDDPALNAFATGRNPDRAAVAITSGLLQKLNRDELQGVIGHEIAQEPGCAVNGNEQRPSRHHRHSGVVCHTPHVLRWNGQKQKEFLIIWRSDSTNNSGGSHHLDDTGTDYGTAYLLRYLPEKGISG